MTFGDALNQAMGSLSQHDLGVIAGIDDSLISRYLSGCSEPTMGKLVRLMKALPRLHALLPRIK